jgi:bifunctional DNA-binding transcriptional regulator/antitoxin component of YhaV-PrlF toxin-antitoxin module
MTVTLKNKTPLTAPDRVRQEARLKSGDQVEFHVSGRVIRIVPKPPLTQGSEDTLTSAEAKMVRRGEAQLKRGQSKSWRDVKNALAR